MGLEMTIYHEFTNTKWNMEWACTGVCTGVRRGIWCVKGMAYIIHSGSRIERA
jgi:hypothetical protein